MVDDALQEISGRGPSVVIITGTYSTYSHVQVLSWTYITVSDT